MTVTTRTALATAALLGSLAAQSVPLVNGSFEAHELGAGRYGQVPGSDAIAGWRIAPSSTGAVARLELLVASNSLPAADGSSCVHLGAFPNRAAALEQDVATVVDERYRLRFRLAGDYTGLPLTKTVRVTAGDGDASFTWNLAGHTPRDMGWLDRALEFTALAATTTLRIDPQDQSGIVALIDDVRLELASGAPPDPLPPDPVAAESVDLGGPGCVGDAVRLTASPPHLGGELRIDYAGCAWAADTVIASAGPAVNGALHGCAVWLDGNAIVFVLSLPLTGVDGRVGVTLPIPNAAVLRGLRLTLQGIGTCWSGNFDATSSVTNGVSVRIGD